jgi:hypothetical protein
MPLDNLVDCADQFIAARDPRLVPLLFGLASGADNVIDCSWRTDGSNPLSSSGESSELSVALARAATSKDAAFADESSVPYDPLTTFLSAVTCARMRTASVTPSNERSRHRHSAWQRIDAAVLVLLELLHCRARRHDMLSLPIDAVVPISNLSAIW